MTRSRLLNLILSGLLGAMTALPPTATLADDTEIYLGASASADGVRPNVLFILDTSGSMAAAVDSNGDRLDHMKNAFFQIMDTVNNINVGLMRFTDPGGPILWPVSFVDDDVEVIEGSATQVGFPVNVRVLDRNDDGEEVVSTGAVNLISDELNLVDSDAGVTSTSISHGIPQNADMRVAAQADNAEENSNGSIVTKSQIDMNNSQTNAVRFRSVPIPFGSTIVDARIVFTSRGGNSRSPTFVIRGESNVVPIAFPTSCNRCNDVSNRTTTDTHVSWSPPKWSKNEKGADTTTPNLAGIVQSIVDLPGWVTGNPMVFIIEKSARGSRGAYSFDGSGNKAGRRPELQVTYLGGLGEREKQVTGMRFLNVAVPQGATITKAVLEFFPSTILTADIDVDIVAEASDDSPPFTGVSADFTGRPKTDAVNWKETDDWDEDLSVPLDGVPDVPHQTVNIRSLIQAVVDRPGWCGNNAMALYVRESAAKLNGPLKAASFDFDQSRAPMLRIDYEQDNVPPNACINTTLTNQVFTSSDDAEETIRNGSISLGGKSFDMRSTQINALRFPNINIEQGATIVDATLTFVARKVDTNSTTLSFQAEAIDDSPGLTSTARDISDRSVTSESVNWTPPPFDTIGEQYTTVSLTPIIQEVVNRAGWDALNALTIIQSHVSGSKRRARTFNHDAVDAPILTIRVQGASSTATLTVRNKLKQLVDNLGHAGHTPIIDTYYEAAKYYRGEDVVWGKQRGFDNASGHPACASTPHRCNAIGSNPTVRQNTRISHPASWTGGVVTKPSGCTDTNLNSPNCRNEAVTGSPIYKTPIEESCQANYIVLLTDGMANHNDSVPLIESEFGLTCPSATGDESCGVELAEMLSTTDQIAGLAGEQNVFTYTIGFNFSSSFLSDLADAGGGESYTADNSSQLAEVFQLIIADILNRSSSFSSPALSVNAFNRLFDLSDIYFAYFTPDSRVSWRGNVKKYRICDDELLCDIGDILDVNGDLAVNETTGTFEDTAQSFWSTSPDGAEIELGGAAEFIPTYTSRVVYTNTDLTDPIVNPLNLHLGANENVVEDIDDDGILDGLSGSPAQNLADTQFLLGDDLQILSAADRAELIDWIRGRDTEDEDEDGSTADDRYSFGAALHASPVVVTFGGTDADPVIKLFAATNDGGLRMINASNGQEEWIFYPQDMLREQIQHKSNPNGNHIYGLDLTPAVWLNDVNSDGAIVRGDGDFVRLIVGQRRGGMYYYAIDVTPDHELTDPNAIGGVEPELMWRIDGGQGDYPTLGQTWSIPVVARIRSGTTTAGESELKTVLAFTGGYDDVQDDGSFGPSSPANAIYLVEAETGDLVYTIGGDDLGQPITEFLHVEDMKCPLPSDLAMFDADGDGALDRIYVGDVCGQVWRVDVSPNRTANESGVRVVVGKFAELSDTGPGFVPDPLAVADHRKIFYPPEIVPVLNDQFSTLSRYDLVVVLTGRRDNPLNLDVLDRAYSLRDFHVEPMTDVDNSGFGDGFPDGTTYTTISGPTASNSSDDLFDATFVIDDPIGAQLDDLQTSKGWYIDFTDPGEKALAAPVVLGGKLFFTTYLPAGVAPQSSCTLAEGHARLFAVDVLTGGVVFNYDDADGTETHTVSDKSKFAGNGISSDFSVYFGPDGALLQYQTQGTPMQEDPDLDDLFGRTYWYAQ